MRKAIESILVTAAFTLVCACYSSNTPPASPSPSPAPTAEPAAPTAPTAPADPAQPTPATPPEATPGAATPGAATPGAATPGAATPGTPSATPTTPATPAAPTTPTVSACVRSGCSSTMCVEAGKEMMTTCEYMEKYACYDSAKCEKQADGKCGWTKSATLDSCLKAGGPGKAKTK